MVDAQKEFELRGPWITRFWVDGVPCGGDTFDPTDDARIAMFVDKTGPLEGKRILELGPLEGGHTIQLARKGASVIGIEGHESNYQRCLFVKDFFKLDNVEFKLGDLRTFDLTALGPIDFIFNVGVLYHLDEPWKLLTSLRSVAPAMFVSTHCAPHDKIDETVHADGYHLEGYWWQEGPLEASLSGLQPRSFWPNKKSLETMMRRTGWPTLKWIDYNAGFTNGPLAAVWVEQAPANGTGLVSTLRGLLRR
jgi:hypothetical protein